MTPPPTAPAKAPPPESGFSADGRWFLSQLARAVAPKRRLGLAAWAEANIVLSADTNSPRIGPLRLHDVGFIKPILARLDPSDPCRGVNVLGAAQSAKSLIGQIWALYSIAENPGPIGVYLPSLDDARKYSQEKIQAVIDGSPALRHRVRPVSSRSGSGSSALLKRFAGGSLRIATASSPNALQMVSFRDLILEEVAGYEPDVGDRGSPIDQAKKRQRAWLKRGAKWLQLSAGGVLGSCPSSEAHARGTAHELYAPCPHCCGFERHEFEGMQPPTDQTGAHFVCSLCGGVIENHHQAAMVAASVYIATYDDAGDDANPAPPTAFAAVELERWQARPEKGRSPSYRWWVYVSPFVAWNDIWAEAQAAQAGGRDAQKVFCQQTLARAWDDAVDAPDFDELSRARGAHVKRGVVPAWACMLTGAADVQNDRIEWAVYAWGPDQTGARIDWGVCEGDTATAEPFNELAQVASRRWPGEACVDLGLDAFGIDSGGAEGRTAQVYDFARRSSGVKALKGSSRHDGLPLEEGSVGKAKTRGGRYTRAKVWLVNAYALKKTVYSMLFRGVAARDEGARLGVALYYTIDTPLEHFKQLTAEVFREPKSRRAGARGVWEHIAGRANEQLDLAVYCLALALDKGLARFGPTEWAQMFAARARPKPEAPAPIDAPEPEAAPPKPAAAQLARNPSSAAPGALPAWMQRMAAMNNTRQE